MNFTINSLKLIKFEKQRNKVLCSPEQGLVQRLGAYCEKKEKKTQTASGWVKWLPRSKPSLSDRRFSERQYLKALVEDEEQYVTG